MWELGLFCAGYVGYSLGHSLPAPELFAWVLAWIWAVGLAGVPLLLALFPDGLWPGRRWRLVGVGALAALVLLFAGSAFVPGPLADVPALENPVGIDGLEPLAAVGGVLLTASLVASLAAFAFRLRRASPLERRQLKWVAVAVATIFAGLLAAGAARRARRARVGDELLQHAPARDAARGDRHRDVPAPALRDVDRALLASWERLPWPHSSGSAAVSAVGAAAGSVLAALAGGVAALALQRLRPRREQARPAVEVRTLGGFRVLRHGEPLPA